MIFSLPTLDMNDFLAAQIAQMLEQLGVPAPGAPPPVNAAEELALSPQSKQVFPDIAADYDNLCTYLDLVSAVVFGKEQFGSRLKQPYLAEGSTAARAEFVGTCSEMTYLTIQLPKLVETAKLYRKMLKFRKTEIALRGLRRLREKNAQAEWVKQIDRLLVSATSMIVNWTSLIGSGKY
jgi:hypothetical protein